MRGHKLVNIWFWWSSTGRILCNLLRQSACSPGLQDEFLWFYVNVIIPLLGPIPAEYNASGIQPTSHLSDDHTPMEVIWVIQGDNPRPSIRFAIEPLLQPHGTPMQPTSWIKIVHSFSTLTFVKTFDPCWAEICYNTLIDPEPQLSRKIPQFFLGTVFFLSHEVDVRLTLDNFYGRW